MKFSNIILAVFGFSTIAAAIPAPIPATDKTPLLKARELTKKDPAEPLTKRGTCANLVADVQVYIDAVTAINNKYAAQKPYTRTTSQNWAGEVAIKIKALIAVITAYPAGCAFPPVNDCVDVFVKLIVTIFVQLEVFVNFGGLLGVILLAVDLLLWLLLGLCGDLLNVVVALLVLIEVKIQVGICGLIVQSCGGLIDSLYLQALVQLLIQAGLPIAL
ncbi:uncharacterized protein DFL_009452 [Arthrobotrys flagrans]|uniref:Uncharacterized protein n=1 Tax=Arthrobotrys flagrans TaxID=97331 RepID=A0A436ZRU5_ARTFL|nr:hypothetical protein DFL_009452 [Arthrobotrys flagrans]